MMYIAAVFVLHDDTSMTSEAWEIDKDRADAFRAEFGPSVIDMIVPSEVTNSAPDPRVVANFREE